MTRPTWGVLIKNEDADHFFFFLLPGDVLGARQANGFYGAF